MNLFEGKTKTERNKIIAAGVLGLVALIALYLAFGRGMFGGTTTTATVKIAPTPKPGGSPAAIRNDAVLPTADDQRFIYETTPVIYNAGGASAPDPGRNIFAFYEPPPPTPWVPTPTPAPPPVKPPTPTPTPVFFATSVNPQSTYAGSRGFRLEVNGDRFTPDARIYFNQTEIPTTFVNAQRLSADIPANLISQAGLRQIIVQTPDGRAYSFPLTLVVEQPPTPAALQYIGMIGRKRYNNDTAYFLEGSATTPFGRRLNDVVSTRFRLIDISAAEVVFEDIYLGFKHRLPLSKGGAAGTSGQPVRTDGGFVPYNPGQGDIPGIPNNLPRYVQPPQPQPQKQIDPKRQDKKDDVDDNDDGPDRK